MTGAVMLVLGIALVDTIDLGAPDDGSGPLAVMVPQPGLRRLAYVDLAESLESGGYDAVLLRETPSPDAQAELIQRVISAAQPDRPVLLVAHGQAARAVLEQGPPAGVCATALLGVPRHLRPAPWHASFRSAEVPVSGVDLREAHPAAPTPLRAGAPRSWLGRLPAAWVDHLQRALDGPPPPIPEGPLWLGVAPLDELAPPESLGQLPEHPTVTRWGMLRGWTQDATYADLLTDPRPAAHLATWGRRHCTR